MRTLDAGQDTSGVNIVIAEHARERPASELWTTMGGGCMNAVLLWTQFPSLHWLASAFAAVAAYGAWGLLDRVMRDEQLTNANGSRRFTWLARGMVGLAGWGAALFAIATFMGAALGGLSLPGR